MVPVTTNQILPSWDATQGKVDSSSRLIHPKHRMDRVTECPSLTCHSEFVARGWEASSVTLQRNHWSYHKQLQRELHIYIYTYIHTYIYIIIYKSIYIHGCA